MRHLSMGAMLSEMLTPKDGHRDELSRGEQEKKKAEAHAGQPRLGVADGVVGVLRKAQRAESEGEAQKTPRHGNRAREPERDAHPVRRDAPASGKRSDEQDNAAEKNGSVAHSVERRVRAHRGCQFSVVPGEDALSRLTTCR